MNAINPKIFRPSETYTQANRPAGRKGWHGKGKGTHARTGPGCGTQTMGEEEVNEWILFAGSVCGLIGVGFVFGVTSGCRIGAEYALKRLREKYRLTEKNPKP